MLPNGHRPVRVDPAGRSGDSFWSVLRIIVDVNLRRSGYGGIFFQFRVQFRVGRGDGSLPLFMSCLSVWNSIGDEQFCIRQNAKWAFVPFPWTPQADPARFRPVQRGIVVDVDLPRTEFRGHFSVSSISKTNIFDAEASGECRALFSPVYDTYVRMYTHTCNSGEKCFTSLTKTCIIYEVHALLSYAQPWVPAGRTRQHIVVKFTFFLSFIKNLNGKEIF